MYRKLTTSLLKFFSYKNSIFRKSHKLLKVLYKKCSGEYSKPMNLPMITESGDMAKIAGFQLHAKHVAVFTAYISLLNISEVSLVTGQREGTIRNWMGKDWWKELEEMYMDAAFRESSIQLAQTVSTQVLPFLKKAFEETEELTDVEVRHLNVRRGISQLLLSAGSKPLLRMGGGTPGPKVVINNSNNTQVNNNGSIDVDRMKALTSEQKHKIAMGGEIPEAIIQKDNGGE